MQCYSCVCIYGPAEPQNWFNPGDGGGCIPIDLFRLPSWNSYSIF